MGIEPRAGFEYFLAEDIPDELENFSRFLKLKKNLSRRTVQGHHNRIRRFLYSYNGKVSPATIEGYLTTIKEKWNIKTYANYLCSFRRYIRDFKKLDYVDDYEFPEISIEPIIIPTKEQIRKFFYALPNAKLGKNNKPIDEPKYKALLLFLASSGLRIGEALSLNKKDIDFHRRMVVPNGHDTNTTKKDWVARARRTMLR